VNALEAHELRHLDLGELLSKLGAQPQAMTHLLVEPGPTLARSFFHRNLADRLWIFRSRDRLEEPTAPDAAGVPLNWLKTAETDLAGDTLTEYLNPANSAFFAPQPSADFRLAAGELE
jgi:riboflavin biosynthesis pyrimidine reductase